MTDKANEIEQLRVQNQMLRNEVWAGFDARDGIATRGQGCAGPQGEGLQWVLEPSRHSLRHLCVELRAFQLRLQRLLYWGPAHAELPQTTQR